METNKKVWAEMETEIEGNFPWMIGMDRARRGDVVMALGAGLPGKVLMSW